MWVLAFGVSVALVACVGYVLWWFTERRKAVRLLTHQPVANDDDVPALVGERCDVCGAQAYVETLHGAHSLLWCVHHYRKHEAHLAPLVIRDASMDIAARLEAS